MKQAAPAVCSTTPLAKKLGIVAGVRLVARHAPDDYLQLLEPLPPDVVFEKRLSRTTNIVHVFVTQKSNLIKELVALRKTLPVDSAVWVSWYKKAAKIPTDITENDIRELALSLGFVDVKLCAVNDIWSGLKLVVRKELR